MKCGNPSLVPKALLPERDGILVISVDFPFRKVKLRLLGVRRIVSPTFVMKYWRIEYGNS